MTARRKGLEHVIWVRIEAVATRISTGRDVANESLVTKGVSRLPKLYKQNPEDNFEFYETKRLQPS